MAAEVASAALKAEKSERAVELLSLREIVAHLERENQVHVERCATLTEAEVREVSDSSSRLPLNGVAGIVLRSQLRTSHRDSLLAGTHGQRGARGHRRRG